MFEGKMLRELAGTPIRSTDLANSPLALAEPEPLTLANLTTKSLTASSGFGMRAQPVSSRKGTSACPMRRSDTARRRDRNEGRHPRPWPRSEEHTSELQSPDTISYAVFCLK